MSFAENVKVEIRSMKGQGEKLRLIRIATIAFTLTAKELASMKVGELKVRLEDLWKRSPPAKRNLIEVLLGLFQKYSKGMSPDAFLYVSKKEKGRFPIHRSTLHRFLVNFCGGKLTELRHLYSIYHSAYQLILSEYVILTERVPTFRQELDMDELFGTA